MRYKTIMKYQADYSFPALNKREENSVISIEKEGLLLGSFLLDYAEVNRIRPVNHRVFLDLFDGESVEVSMLGFSYDGFFEELLENFGKRSLEALFVEETEIMSCEGEYELPEEGSRPGESGRCQVALYPDSVCILPQTSRAVRIPLCFTSAITLEGYWLFLQMRTGELYKVGKMGYDTKPFAERCLQAAEKTKKTRNSLLSGIRPKEPFLNAGLFRTSQTDEHWEAAFGNNCCAVELYTNENAATYLYRFGDRVPFLFWLEEAMEAVGSHREIIFLPEEQLNEKPLYRMAVYRSRAVRFLRSCSAGRLIHNNTHSEKLNRFLKEQTPDLG